MTERFMVDDAGTLIDMYTRDMFDIVEEVCPLLNELYEDTKSSKEFIEQLQEELVLFKEAGANMGIDLNAQITALKEENEQLRKENNKLHQRIFEMRTNIALERTEISRQTYTGKKNEKEYLDAKEFLDELEKW